MQRAAAGVTSARSALAATIPVIRLSVAYRAKMKTRSRRCGVVAVAFRLRQYYTGSTRFARARRPVTTAPATSTTHRSSELNEQVDDPAELGFAIIDVSPRAVHSAANRRGLAKHFSEQL